MRHVLILFDTRVTHRGSCLVNRRYQRLNFLSLNLLLRTYNAKRAVSLSVSCASSPHNFIVWGGPGRKGLISVKITPHVHPLPPHHNECLDKKDVPCRENILHHARKLEIFDGRAAGYFLRVKSTQFMFPLLPSKSGKSDPTCLFIQNSLTISISSIPSLIIRRQQEMELDL